MAVTTVPLHLDEDGSPCRHPVPGVADCPGLLGHRSTCSACSWHGASATEALAAALASRHLAHHRAELTRPGSQRGIPVSGPVPFG